MHMNYFGLQSSVFATTSSSVSLTNAGVSHTKGAWTTIIASTSRATNRLGIVAEFGTVNRDALIDIAIGAAASEIVIINNIPCSEFSGDVNGVPLDFPVSIPAGSRIAGRQQVSGTTGSFELLVRPYWGYVPQGTHAIQTYGAVTATSAGTVVDPGTSSGTKGSWTEMAASTTSPHSTLWVTVPGAGSSRSNSTNIRIDIGIGGSGSEVVLIPNLAFFVYSVTDTFTPNSFGPFYVNIPAGSRLSARASMTVTTSPARLVQTIIYAA